jgi:hypothetical protein
MSVSTPVGARQRLDKQASEAMNTHPGVGELLDAVFSMPSVSYQILSM